MTVGGGAVGAGDVALMDNVLIYCFGVFRSTREECAMTGESSGDESDIFSGRKKGRRRRSLSSAVAPSFSPAAHLHHHIRS